MREDGDFLLAMQRTKRLSSLQERDGLLANVVGNGARDGCMHAWGFQMVGGHIQQLFT